jgi:CBS domain-containing protein
VNERTLSDLFHLVKRLVPEHQQLITIAPASPVSEALRLMREHNFSQLPVTVGDEVLGLFSYRSFALKLPEVLGHSRNAAPLTLHVDLFLDSPTYANGRDEIADYFTALDTQAAVLVGSPDRVHAVVTSSDALAYFYAAASPYYLLGEGEVAIRELIGASISKEQLQECIQRSLKQHYETNLKQELPTSLDGLTLNDLVMLLRYRGTWELFETTFGKNQDYATAKLAKLPGLRNDVFHFKRQLTLEDLETLRQARDWLLGRVKQADARNRERNANV